MIPRNISKSFLELLTSFRIVSLTGPRQSGKTTFLKGVLKDYRYVNLENKDNREYAERDPNGFLKEYDDKVIFDEAQKVPDIFSYLQQIVDENNKPGQFILSGSQNFLLSKNISQSLAGRVGIMRLLPFENDEIKEQLLEDSWAQLFKGYYPEIYKGNISPNLYYKNYIDTYVKRDVYELINIHNESQFRTFLSILATHAGQELNLHTISKQVGITHPTANSWLSILETSYIIFRLPPYFKNYNKRLIKSPKIYFYDTGLLCQLLGFNDEESLKKYANRGSIFENLVISEMIKQNYHKNLYNEFFYWKESNKTEVDLLIPEANGLNVYEIKSSQTLTYDKYEGLIKFEKISTDPILSKTLIHAGKEQKHTRFGCETVSWDKVSLQK
jgi:predicted AAA+ superfamily ATPase